MVTFNGLPLYRATLAGEDDGVVRVSLVDDPAVQSNFDYFKNEKQPVLYSVQNEEKRLVRGVVLRADFPIYRRDESHPDGYYVTFGKEVIRKAAERYLTEGHANAVDMDHDGQEVEGVQMVQLFIKDSEAGVSPEGFEDIADGSLFAEYHVTDDAIWEDIKAGTYKGFSVEIFYTLIPVAEQMRSEDDRALLDRLFDKIADKMSFAKFKERLAEILAQPEAEPEKFGSVTTDKGPLYWEGEEDLKAGDRVEGEDEEGNRKPAEDGEYVTPDNKVIVVAGGEVAEIKDPEAEVAPAEGDEQMQAAKMAAQSRSAKFEESYDEKMRRIVDAIIAARGNREDEGGYLVNAGDDFAVWAYWSEATGWQDKYVRYAVKWDEEGNASVSDPVDVRPAFVPMDFDDSAAFNGTGEQAEMEAQMEQALSAAESFKAENAELKARVAELEKTPAAPSVQDQYKNEAPDGVNVKTGVKGIDRLARIMNA